MEKVSELVEGGWDEASGRVEMWEVIRNGMVMAAEDTLGWETRKQPDWFREKGHLDLIERRNSLFQRWLRSGKNEGRQRYVVQRRDMAKAVRKAKNDRLQEKARAVCCPRVLEEA